MIWKRQISSHTTKQHRRLKPPAHERGQGLIEYSLILVLISLVGTASLVAVGPAVKNAYCSAISTLNPEATGMCSSETGDTGVTILNANYDDKNKELRLTAKAPKDCSGDLQVQGYGAMTRQGNSFVFKKTISSGSPPSHVSIGSDACGWTTTGVE